MKRLIYILIIIAIPVFCFAENGNDLVQAELLSSVKKFKPGEPFKIAVLLDIEKDWHLYWKNPGDAGMAIDPKLDAPAKFKVSDWRWPIPKQFPFQGLVNFGYEKQVLLIASVNPFGSFKPGSEYEFNLDLSWLVCKEKCLPGSDSLSLTLTAAESAESHNEHLSLIDKYQAKLPLVKYPWTFKAIEKEDKLVIIGSKLHNHPHELDSAYFIPAHPGIVKYSEPQIFTSDRVEFQLSITLDPFRVDMPDFISGLIMNPKGWTENDTIKTLYLKNIKLKKSPK